MRVRRFSEEVNFVDANFYFVGRSSWESTGSTGLVLFAGEIDREELIRNLELAVERIGRLRQRIRPAWAEIVPPTWIDFDSFDVGQHVSSRHLPQPACHAEFLSVVDEIHEARFDMSRPPWSITLVTGLCTGDTALVLKVHHCLSDGSVLMDLFAAGIFGLPPAFAYLTRAARPSRAVATVVTATRRLGAAMSGSWRAGISLATADGRRSLRDSARTLAHRRPYAQGPGPRRNSYLFSVREDDWIRAARARGGGVNELYLALAARLWTEYFGDLGERAVRVGMPVSRRDLTVAEDGGNSIGTAIVAVPPRAGTFDDLAAMRRAARNARDDALRASPTLVDVIQDLLPGFLRGGVAFRRSGWQHVAASNLIWPYPNPAIRQTPVRTMYFLPPTIGSPISLVLCTYKNLINVAVTVDPAVLPDRPGLDTTIGSLLEELDLEVLIRHSFGASRPRERNVETTVQLRARE